LLTNAQRLLFALGFLLYAPSIAMVQGIAPPQAPSPESFRSRDSADAQAAACANTVQEFVSALDAVLEENPRSILKYHAILSKYLYLNNGIPNLPRPAPGASIQGCRVEDADKIAKRSKFLFDVGRPPVWAHYRFEFRNGTAKVSFSISPKTGDVVYPTASWIKVYP
jgi:hypothetical protein